MEKTSEIRMNKKECEFNGKIKGGTQRQKWC
jgi:hypothetical protein